MLQTLEQWYAGLKSTYNCGTEEIGLTAALDRRMKNKYMCVVHKRANEKLLKSVGKCVQTLIFPDTSHIGYAIWW